MCENYASDKDPVVFCFSYLMHTVHDYETTIVQVQGPHYTFGSGFYGCTVQTEQRVSHCFGPQGGPSTWPFSNSVLFFSETMCPNKRADRTGTQLYLRQSRSPT